MLFLFIFIFINIILRFWDIICERTFYVTLILKFGAVIFIILELLYFLFHFFEQFCHRSISPCIEINIIITKIK